MPTTIGVSPSHSGHGPLSSIRYAVRNFFERLGFKPLPASESTRSRKHMSRLSHSWGIFPAFPRDYIRRRRVMRRISNVVIVVLLSTAIAYVIVHFSGPAAFSAPHR